MSDSEPEAFKPDDLDYESLFADIREQNPDLEFDGTATELASIALRDEPLDPEEFSRCLDKLADSILETSPARILPDQATILAKLSTLEKMHEVGPAQLEIDAANVYGLVYGMNDDAPPGNHRDLDIQNMIAGRRDYYDLQPTDEEIDAATPDLVGLPALLIAEEKLPVDIFLKMADKLIATDPLLQTKERHRAVMILSSRIRIIASAMFGSQPELAERWQERSRTYIDSLHKLLED